MQAQKWFETRSAQRHAFLTAEGWGDATISPVGEDSAMRRYFRLTRAGAPAALPGRESVILMEALPDGHALATPGHSMNDFIRYSTYLRNIGIAAPEVYAIDREDGYLLIEDFGDMPFKKALVQNPAGGEELYELATDVLSWLRQNGKSGDDLPDYYKSHVHTGRRRLVDWYIPALRRAKNRDGLVEEYLAVWGGIEHSLDPVPRGILHIDYHFENLMLRHGQTGLAQCGVLDFQGAMNGPLPYDLANLLEDARVDVPTDLRDRMMDRYCATMTPAERENFQKWYRVLATQFHCRVIGQFIRLAVRDNKTRYLAMIPRLEHYLREGLKDPVLKPLADWLSGQGIDFASGAIPGNSFQPDELRPYIRPDAF